MLRLLHITALSTFLALFCVSPSISQVGGEGPMVEAKYLGSRGYPTLTRLVFDTGGVPPTELRVDYDAGARKVVFYPEKGVLAFSFSPVGQVDDLVRDVDFTETDDGKRAIVVRLGQEVKGVRASYLPGPYRLVLDVYRNTQARTFLPPGRAVRTVAIDPGHGGRDRGSAAGNGMSEKDFAFDMSVRLRNSLARLGYKVVMTRAGDAGPSPDDRAGAANGAAADLFVSLHAGGSFTKGGGGMALYVQDPGELDGGGYRTGQLHWGDQNAAFLPDSLRLARRLAAAAGKVFDRQPALHDARLAGFGGLSMPAVLVEIGDLDDPAQAAAMAEDAFRGKVAARLAKGIDDYAKGGGGE